MLATLAGVGLLVILGWDRIGVPGGSERPEATPGTSDADLAPPAVPEDPELGRSGPGQAGGPGPFPDGTDTGPPAGIELQDVGPLLTSRDGQVIDGVRASGIEVRHSDVTIRNSRIDSTGIYGIVIPYRLRDQISGLVIEDTEIVGISGQRSAGLAPFGSWTARRIEVRGFEDGVKVGSDQLLEDSWIHSLYVPAGSHADAIQSVGGSNVTIRNNTIEGPWRGQTSAIIIQSEVTGVSDYRIQGNRISGGTYSVYIRDKGNGHGAPRNMVITDNTWVRGSYQFGPHSIDMGANWTLRDNVYDDGTPLE